MWGIALLVLKLTTIFCLASPCDRWIVLAASGRNGNCFLTTWAVLFLPTANWVVIGFIGVHVRSIPCTYSFLFSCLVFSPTSAWCAACCRICLSCFSWLVTAKLISGSRETTKTSPSHYISRFIVSRSSQWIWYCYSVW